MWIDLTTNPRNNMATAAQRKKTSKTVNKNTHRGTTMDLSSLVVAFAHIYPGKYFIVNRENMLYYDSFDVYLMFSVFLLIVIIR